MPWDDHESILSAGWFGLFMHNMGHTRPEGVAWSCLHCTIAQAYCLASEHKFAPLIAYIYTTYAETGQRLVAIITK